MVKKWWIAIPIVLSLSLGGCAGEELPDPIKSPAVVEGTWVATGPEGENVTLELRPDGSMSFSHMPIQIVNGSQPWEVEWSDLISRRGTWSVDSSDGGFEYLGFLFAKVDGETGMLLGLDHNESGWFVTYPLDWDGGFRLDFERVEPPVPSSS